MFADTFATIRRAYSGEAAKAVVAGIIQHHRIQATPGYRAAAEYVLAELQKAGLAAHIETFPAQENARFWNAPSFQEWSVTRARLDLLAPAGQARKLADYDDLKLSLIQRSAAFAGDVELVVLEGGGRPEDYEGLDVSGKVVLTNANAGAVQQLAVERFGAVGILFDGLTPSPPVREAMDLPDARQYTSFWWRGHEKKCFGFVLSPRQGQWLRRLAAQEAAAGRSVRLHARVEAEFYDGEMEVVVAEIPGVVDEQVVIVSHLCHPQPSANDNGSGGGANLEIARCLHRLITDGELASPARTIRFLWLPEMTGSYAYLSGHEAEIPTMIAGLNLDMVGADQEQTGAVFELERPPEALSSFAPDLLEKLREYLFDDVRSYTGLGAYPLFRYVTTPFAGGSDHLVFSDPSVGVPMPMIIQWPDKFYHTSEDTLEKVSPATLKRSGSLAAAYAYFIATAGLAEATWLGHEMLTRFQGRVTAWTGRQVAELSHDRGAPAVDVLLDRLTRQYDFYHGRLLTALHTLTRLAPEVQPRLPDLIASAEQFLDGQRRQVRLAVDQLVDTHNGSRAGAATTVDAALIAAWEAQAAKIRPVRHYRGPGVAIGVLAALPAERRRAWLGLLSTRDEGGWTLAILAEFWADGRRTALEIIDLIEMETGVRDPELVVGCFELLRDLGLVTW